MEIIDPVQGAIATEADIREALVEFVETTKNSAPVPSIASLTTQSRDVWGKARLELLHGNEASFHAIETAVLHCCLDQSQPESMTEFYEACLHGGKHHEARFYDKSITLIVTPDAQACCNFEHSPMDGATIIRMMNDVWHDAQGLSSGLQLPTMATTFSSVNGALSPTLIPFAITPEQQTRLLQKADQSFGVFRSNTMTRAFRFSKFGAAEMKRWKSGGPDSILQMAFQMAYFRVHGKTKISTYAAARYTFKTSYCDMYSSYCDLGLRIWAMLRLSCSHISFMPRPCS
jgi:carnitine O-acetyltransferase